LKLSKKLNTQEKIKKLLTFVTSGQFIVSLVLAASLWAYVTLNNEYMTYVKLPLTIILPGNRAMEESLPEEISVEIKGSGWNIINLSFFNSSAKCEVDLSNNIISQEEYKISRSDLLKSVQFLGNVEPMDILPESIIVRTGSIGRYNVPVVPAFAVVPREGFTIVDEPRLYPSSVTIKGNNSVVSTIKSWNTIPMEISDVYHSFNLPMPLSDSLQGIVSLNYNMINISVDIQQIGEVEVQGVKLKVRGGTIQNDNRLSPLTFDVTVQGPVDIIADITREDISVQLDYIDILNDSTGVLKPKVVVPKNVKVLSNNPKYVYHVRSVNTLLQPEI